MTSGVAMALEEDIRHLAARSLAALDALHDYYTHTQAAWRIVALYTNEGRRFTVRDKITGSAANEQDLLTLARAYISGQLATGTFKDAFAVFEEFFFGLLRLWLTAYPGSLADLEIKFARVLKAGNLDTLIQELIGERLNRRQYTGVRDWFKYLNTQMALGVPSPDQIDRIAELKAARDILEHHQGIVNEDYRRKAGARARFNVGDRLAISPHYHRESWTLLRNVVREIAEAAEARTAGTSRAASASATGSTSPAAETGAGGAAEGGASPPGGAP
jgi:hypothetical protein